MDFLTALDVSIFRALNNLCGSSPVLDRAVAQVEFLKGSLFMGIVGLIWYWPDKKMAQRREIILTIILAVAVSLVLNRVLSMLVPFRVRPMYSIGVNAPTFPWHPDLENWSSFPSDNATYIFAIAADFWLISRWLGLFFVIARVYLGIHYPSDVIVGAMIGITTSAIINQEPVRKRIAAHVLTLEPRYAPYFYGLFFVALAEVSGGFPNTRRIAVAIVHLFIGYNH
jgi:undecaprenyl-diphosphatase